METTKLKSQLTELGFSGGEIGALFNRFPAEYIEQKVNYTLNRERQNLLESDVYRYLLTIFRRTSDLEIAQFRKKQERTQAGAQPIVSAGSAVSQAGSVYKPA